MKGPAASQVTEDLMKDPSTTSKGKSKGAAWKKHARAGFILKGLMIGETQELPKSKEGPDIVQDYPKRLKLDDSDCIEVGTFGQPRRKE